MAYSTIKPDPYFGKDGKNFYLQYDPDNGNVALFESGIQAIFTSPIFFDGKFRQDFLDNLKVTEQEKNDLFAKIQTDVRNSHIAAGGIAKQKVLPPWADASNQGKPPEQTTNPIPGAPTASGGIPAAQTLIDLLGSGLPDIQNLKFESVNEISLFKDHPEWLKYPFDILDNHQDTLQITMYNYKAPLGDTFLPKNGQINTGEIFKNGLKRNSALKQSIGTVILPIPSGIQDNNNISWGDDQMNNMSAGVLSYMLNQTGQAISGQLLAQIGTAAAQAKNLNLPTQSIIQLLTLGAAGAGGSPLLKPAIVSLLLKNAGFELPPETILARGAGIVPNSNLELLFQGPTLRQFGFNWRMSPRSEKEARNVKRIIRFFKQGSAPRKLNSSSGSGANSFFLGTPNVFKLSYKTAGNKEISGLNKFKICALVGMNVVYAPDGQWAAYDEGQPVSLTMSLNFQEIEPVYESDYQKDISSGFKDNDDYSPVDDNDVGY